MLNRSLRNLIASTLVSFVCVSAHAAFKPYTPDELAQWEAACSKNPKCATAWEGLKKKQANRNAELEKICSKKTKECQKQVEARAFEMLREFTECEAPETCLTYINETAAPNEKKLLDGPWCGANPRVCEYVKSRRDRRVAQSKSWCEEYANLCQQAIKGRVEVVEQYEKQRADARHEAEQKRFAELRSRVEEGVAQREQSLAQCGSDRAQCDREINERIVAESKSREQQWCEQSEDLCAVAKVMRQDRESSGTSWCDAHPDVCTKARSAAGSDAR